MNMDDDLHSNKKLSWWDRRTRTEKCLIGFTAIFVIVIIFLASNLLMRFPSKESLRPNVCMTEKCIRSAANMLEKMDKNISPCEDFYKFVCGNFIKDVVIPDNKMMVSTFTEDSDRLLQNLMLIFEEPKKDTDSHSLNLVKTVFNSCMNTTKIEQEGIGFLKRMFEELGGWPLIEPYWNENTFNWTQLVYRLKRIGWWTNFFFNMYVDSDLKNSSRNYLTITQVSLSYERLKKGLNETRVKAYYDAVVELSVLFGADRAIAVSEMKEVIEFLIGLAKIMVPNEETRNISLEYNPITIRELQKNFTNFQWLKLINSFLAPMDLYTSNDVVNLAVPKYFERLNDYLPKVKKRILANYIFSTILWDSVDYLPEKFRENNLDYIQAIYGQKIFSPRWKVCVWEATRLNVAVSSIHVKHFVDKTLKHKVAELIIDIKSAFLETLKKVSWMDKKTKKHAIQKAEKMSSFIGHPEELFDEKLVDEYYHGLELDPDGSYLRINFNLSKFSHLKRIQQLHEPLKSNDWRKQATTYYINAFYIQSDNTIELPAAILQSPFYDPDKPQYMNYGAIGEVIGHEITHGFDDEGRQYDKDGNVVDWWEPETNRTFSKKSQCLVEQYDNFTVPELEITVSGLKTLSENIADNGGIKVAYRGYLKWLQRNKPELSLPGLPYSPRQMFWISSATNWCTKYKKEAVKNYLSTLHHAPNYFRIVIPYMNSDHFGRDFNCPLGSPMNPKSKCRVW